MTYLCFTDFHWSFSDLFHIFSLTLIMFHFIIYLIQRPSLTFFTDPHSSVSSATILERNCIYFFVIFTFFTTLTFISPCLSPGIVSMTTKSMGVSDDRPIWNISVSASNWYSTITAWFLDNVYEILCCWASKIACKKWRFNYTLHGNICQVIS